MMQGLGRTDMGSRIGLGESAVEQEEHAANVLRMRRLTTIALVAWPAFGLVDWFIVAFVNPGRLWVYMLLRGIGILLLGAAAASIFNRPGPSPRMLRFLNVSIFAALSALVSISCLEFKGIASPLALGIVTILLCHSVIVTDHWRRALLPIGLAAAIHPVVLGVLALLSPRIGAQFLDATLLGIFVLNQLFIFSAAVLTVIGGHAVWALRRKVYESRALGRYRLKRRIGKGGMGEVWAAHHRTLKRDVAVKILRPGVQCDSSATLRFEREVQATAELTHPNTIRVFDYGVTEDGLCYYAMELLEGEDLATLLEREVRLPPWRAVGLALQTARALAEAHRRGTVHRDIKPANIFITTVGDEPDLVKVLDFGLAKLRRTEADPAITQKGVAMGTPAYISPEVCLGREADPRTDVYALGAVLYHMLTGRPPFDAIDDHQKLLGHVEQRPRPPSELVTIPRPVERVVMRCLSKNPDLRYASAKALANALAVCEHHLESGVEEPLPEPAPDSLPDTAPVAAEELTTGQEPTQPLLREVGEHVDGDTVIDQPGAVIRRTPERDRP
jgi:serine/threonine-protein kinase